MPDDVTGGPGEAPEEPGDLTARLRMLEDKIRDEGGTAPARRRRTPVQPTEPYRPPVLADDDPLAAVLQPGPDEDAAAIDPTEALPAAEPVDEPPASSPDAAQPAAAKGAEEPVAAPAKKAPATAKPAKAVAKRAPAKKAAPAKAAAAPDTEADTPPAKAPASKRAPAKRPPAARKVPAAAPVAVPDLEATRPTPVPPTAPVPPAVPRPLPRPAAVPAAPVPTAAPALPPATTVTPARGDRVVRVLLTLTVLLLALAAGLGAAAFIQSRSATWSASTVVRLSPGNDPQGDIEQSLRAGMGRYLDKAGSGDFTATAAQRVGVPEQALREDVTASRRAPSEITLVAKAATSEETRLVATAAGDALVELVNLDQTATVSTPGDRLSAEVVSAPTDLKKESPSNGSAWAVGVLAAGAVLLLAGVGFLLRVTRSG